jgi:hypothetical protein
MLVHCRSRTQRWLHLGPKLHCLVLKEKDYVLIDAKVDVPSPNDRLAAYDYPK